MTSTKKHGDKQPTTPEQDDDTLREEQKSHGTQQNRSKKEGHATQIGSGQDQQSSHSRGGSQHGNKR
ncbi:hypothetical protein [Pollutimonas bauzanensis]|uniref:hypothetical protein n=1 Tax=Pollutimonas bauzanensis TaxID=658167 RepID=UPI003341A697